MLDFSTLFGFGTSQWLIGFCLAAILLGARFGLRIVYDLLLARSDFKQILRL